QQKKLTTGLPIKRMLTSRDIEILNFINDFGFCEMPSIQKRFNLKVARSYQILTRLKKMDLIKHEMIFHKKHGFYWLSKKGAAYTSLPAIEKIPIGNYLHQLKIIDVYLKLIKLYPEAKWISERALEQDKFSKGLGQKGHLSDGILLFPDDRKIAIEIELTMKGNHRLEKILNGYRTQFAIAEVWYYCDQSIFKNFQMKVAKRPYIQLFNLQEFLT
ncbi:MAG: hypothetical protein JO149_06045, partial [Gammaproteobacteria bacterium]|nr:hypothetical protein [Gammaproteobacteria bacterium]